MKKTNGVIAAGHPETVAAGLAMFEAGGNAFDAAVACILTACVTEPGLTSLAGGGFLLAHTHTNQNILFDFFTQTPRYKCPISELNFYPVGVNFGRIIQEFHIGLGSMAVPGVWAGVIRVHETLGRLPFSVVAEPAIGLAKQGVEVNSFQAYTFSNLLQPILLTTAEGREIYAPEGDILKTGDRLIMNNFAQTLEALISGGRAEFYQGEIAQNLVRDCQNSGGHLTLEDLNNYRVIEREPLTINYRGKTILTNPPPSAGGTLIAFALELLSAVDLSGIEFGSRQYLELVKTVMQLTNIARTDRLDGNLYQDNITDTFLSSASSYQQPLIHAVNKWGSTTHISVLDQEGNAASVTTSNGEGSGYMIPGTGIMVNNMLGEEDLNPLGFHLWPENVRISSMMSPTLVLNQGKPEFVMGSGGSNRIRTAILQVLLNLIDFNFSVEDAVSNPRFHWENHRLDIEPGFDTEIINSLDLSEQDIIRLWPEKNMFFGGVHTLVRTADGELFGAGDERRSGVSLKS
ncbi:gamma-glutamyltransferase [Planktothrix paucivesiculata]|uniref:Glutathione hydrolase proenzyme n=1 Tax=Planktothrix paucivesiculata PCC 9631 TaxID=671071 RepID=A0A7Z9BLU2_9CYAN|nr:gamma-glutamyltransferase [Planktothrix paucivesiculata]VXD17385.1 Gamma-glutamyltranspeptidase [Planktothrix paucivesiculata PCC 9631]